MKAETICCLQPILPPARAPIKHFRSPQSCHQFPWPKGWPSRQHTGKDAVTGRSPFNEARTKTCKERGNKSDKREARASPPSVCAQEHLHVMSFLWQHLKHSSAPKGTAHGLSAAKLSSLCSLHSAWLSGARCWFLSHHRCCTRDFLPPLGFQIWILKSVLGKTWSF